MEQISTLNHLIYLDIESHYLLNEELFFKSFKQLTQKCSQLKSIKCCLELSSDEILSPLKSLKQLKRLTLTLQYKDNKNDSQKEMNSLFSFNEFEGMNDLTHLSINFPYISRIDGIFITNIGINLPNLQLLRIENEITTDLNRYQLIVKSLCRLSRLEVIPINVWEESIQEMFKTKLIKNCTKIKSFYFGYNSRFNSNYISNERDGSLSSDSDSTSYSDSD